MLGFVDSSLGSGKICSSLFFCAVGCLASFSLLVVQTELWSFFIAMGSLVIRRLSCSWDIMLVQRRLCFFHACAAAFFSVGFWKNFCSVFLSSACSFLFTAFSRQLAVIGILFVVSSTGGYLNGSVLCSSSSQLSFFSCECLLGAWWCSPVWGPCKFSFAFCSSFASV